MRRFVQKWWGVLGIGLVVVAVVVMSRIQRSKLAQQQRYTVAEVYATHWSSKAGKFADAHFSTGGVTYTVSANADKLAGQPLVGRRFVVKFHPPQPQRYQVLYLDAPVPEGFTDIPATGWDKPPFAVPNEVLEVQP